MYIHAGFYMIKRLDVYFLKPICRSCAWDVYNHYKGKGLTPSSGGLSQSRLHQTWGSTPCPTCEWVCKGLLNVVDAIMPPSVV